MQLPRPCRSAACARAPPPGLTPRCFRSNLGPFSCPSARQLALADSVHPLSPPQDMDPTSFVNYRLPLVDRLLGARQEVGLMAQGLQRALDLGRKVIQHREPSQQLKVRVMRLISACKRGGRGGCQERCEWQPGRRLAGK